MTSLLQWLWQGAALTLAVAIALQCLPRINATTRHAVWWLTLVCALAVPFTGDTGPTAAARLAAAGQSGASGLAIETIPLSDGAVGADTWLALPAVPDWLTACAVGIWLGTVLLGCARLVTSVRALHRLRRESQPLPPSIVAALGGVRGGLRGAQLRCSPAIDGACALGLTGSPTIVISDRLLSALEPEALNLIVLHEQMHLRRFDDWSRALQSCVLIVAGLHPAVRFISARIDAEREAACDEAVAALSGEPRRYAASLAAVADLVASAGSRSGRTLAPNAMGTGSLLSRVQRLLDPRNCRHASLQQGAFVAVAMALTVATVGVGRLAPVVVVAASDVEAASESAAVLHAVPSPPLYGRAERLRGLASSAPAADGLVTGSRLPSPSRRDAPTTAGGADGDGAVGRADQSTADAVRPAEASEQDLRAPSSPGLPPTPAATAEPVETGPTGLGDGRLVARAWPVANMVAGAIRGNNVRNREGSGDNGWASTGASTRRAGAAIGSYFSRAGKAVASRF